MEIYTYGKPDAEFVLLQAVDDHDLEGIESEVKLIGEMSDVPFCLRAMKAADWNNDLSPWRAPAVFGNEDFGGGAKEFLKEFMTLTDEKTAAGTGRKYIIGGYSLAGLFALWAACEKDCFAGAAAASPSVWFPDFTGFIRENRIHARAVYLSLGDKEEKTKNRVMATVGDCIRETCDIIAAGGCECTLEWNPGNHFRNADLRTAKAFAWVMNRLREL